MSVRERIPLRLRVADRLVRHSPTLTLRTPYGVLTSADAGLELFARHDGTVVDKPSTGLMRYPYEFAGGDRSAFCPVDAPAWNLKRVINKNFGDKTVASYEGAVRATAEQNVNRLLEGQGESIDVTRLARELVLGTALHTMFGYDLSQNDLAELAEAYRVFNKWSGVTTMTKGFSDRGRSPRLTHAALIADEPVEETKVGPTGILSKVIFGPQQRTFNESLRLIAGQTKNVWDHLVQTQNPIAEGYTQSADRLLLQTNDIILELTNIIGGTVSTPSALLATSLSYFGRLPAEQQERIRNDAEYRGAYFQEIQRLYQPFPFLMRDGMQNIDIDGISVHKGDPFGFYTYTYNRRPDIWGEDAREFRPERFLENPDLRHNVVLFGKGKRRCPSGMMGVSIANACFESIVERYDVSAEGKLKFRVADTLAAKGNIHLHKIEV